MEYRTLGHGDLRVSEIALGTWLTLGSSIDMDATCRLVAHAFERGITFFDTADVYSDGACEVALGRAIAPLPRDRVVLASKCYFATSDHPDREGLSQEIVSASVEGSLRRLGTDYIDLYQCHRSDPDTPLEETVAVFGTLIAAGKVRHWGVSEWTAAEIDRACELARQQHVPPPVSNQTEYSILQRRIEDTLLPRSEQAGLGTLAWSPLAQGVLTGKYRDGARPAGSRGADPFRRQFMASHLGMDRGADWSHDGRDEPGSDRRDDPADDRAARIEGLRPLAESLGVSMAQLALAWCLRNPGVSSLVMGATREGQIDDNAAASGLTLPAEVRGAIDGLFPTAAPPPETRPA